MTTAEIIRLLGEQIRLEASERGLGTREGDILMRLGRAFVSAADRINREETSPSR